MTLLQVKIKILQFDVLTNVSVLNNYIAFKLDSNIFCILSEIPKSIK